MRRITSVTVDRGGSTPGRTVAHLFGRDVRVSYDGVDEAIDSFELSAEIDEATGAVLSLDGDHLVDTGGLIGADVRRGFARAVIAALPDDASRRSLLYSALEDLNGAFLVSGYSMLRTGMALMPREHGQAAAEFQQDICAGWANGGANVELLRKTGETAVPMGPTVARPDDDAGAGSAVASTVAGSVTRRRSLVVGPRDAATDRVAIRAHFRDTFEDAEGPMVMHEYVVHAQIGASDGTIAQVVVEPRVLPWDSCPAAVASADRVVGTVVSDIPTLVRAELRGPGTCTHLNSTLRSLADVDVLMGEIASKSNS